MTRPDQLNSDRQAVGADRRRQGQGRHVQQRPDRLEGRIAGVMQAFRCFAAHAGREQHVGDGERAAERGAAAFREPHGGDVVACGMARPRSMILRSRSLIASR